jgi:hypothetical protein
MKNIEQVILEKLTRAPMMWMFIIVSILCVICFLGTGFIVFASSISFASFGYSLVLLSFLFLYALLRFYIKHDLAN